MRRRLEFFIPIVLFAVLVQLMAPIGAFRAVAQAVSDPLAMASICSGMSASEGQAMPSHTPDSHADCCAFCAAGHGGTAVIDPPLPVFVHLQRQYQRVVWLESTDAVSAVRVGSNAQARAPPAFS
ncbi:MAG: hypothetical protein JWQ17_2224 [Tardiphaga sp.]|jgi:hypothetical protein|nr:hypothetical protein [Tardiphaga sp.]